MATSWFSCMAVSESDSTQETVEVYPNLLNKENVKPLLLQNESAEKQFQNELEEKAARGQKAEAAAAAAAEGDAHLHEEVERADAERARLEVAARRKAQEAARHEALQREAAERSREEEADRYARAVSFFVKQRQQVEVAAAALKETEEKVNIWCKSHGFQDMNTQKKTLRGTTKYPLHTAVKNNNQDIVGGMLTAGVNKDVQDSKNQTPLQLAAKLNSDGSHCHVLTMLRNRRNTPHFEVTKSNSSLK